MKDTRCDWCHEEIDVHVSSMVVEGCFTETVKRYHGYCFDDVRGLEGRDEDWEYGDVDCD